MKREGKRSSAPGWLVVVPRAFARHGNSPTVNHRKPQESMVNDEPEAFHQILTSVKMGKECTNMTRTRWWFRIFFIFTLKMGEDEPILTRNIFQKGLVKPPTRESHSLQTWEHLMSMVPRVDVDWWSSFAAVVVQWACRGQSAMAGDQVKREQSGVVKKHPFQGRTAAWLQESGGEGC